ncbi:N-acetylmuramoyl-L-alanine amidase family protein [Tumebacillus permanentifrigoris]|uniref:N-acetylmuramoyl-L-alanine amidase n=1 Tax=Tumebacillus permanentifrigoris TaxID=378543 RepID=A0A316DDS6_9BACL|nr:N-acetylmuramoyl-L-alanine amidase [Tumebacillus permanentifrigoris]PWK13807.1 N-acetylmuramoyl-L-alanine amidase [Tumebacillus permanentifrigoris]
MIVRPRVVLDPGHGGWESGCIVGAFAEKDVNLAVCLQVRELLESEGVRVLMTREDDRILSAGRRVEFANAQHADLFVSWHCDHLPDTEVRGLSLWVDSRRSDLWQMMMFEQLGERISQVTHQPFLGVFQIRDRILQAVDAPSILIKGGFLSHPEELSSAVTPQFQKLQAQGAAEGILGILNDVQNR